MTQNEEICDGRLIMGENLEMYQISLHVIEVSQNTYNFFKTLATTITTLDTAVHCTVVYGGRPVGVRWIEPNLF